MDTTEASDECSADADASNLDANVSKEDKAPMNPSSSAQPLGEKFESSSERPSVKGVNPLYATLSERRGSYRPQPKNTYLYEVKTSDTLAGIAARFNTTPSELVNLNKLGSHTIFPGQIIYVPELVKPSSPESGSDGKSKSERSLNGGSSPKPGHVHRVSTFEDSGPEVVRKRSPSLLAEDLNKESLSKFLKISAKYITDGEGVVNGVLLVTRNHLMFDPNTSDQLVIEHGVEKYCVVVPMHTVVRAALYPDIVRMKVKGSTPSPDSKSVSLYHSKTTSVKKSRSQSEVIDPGRRLESLSECPGLGEEGEEGSSENLGIPVSNKLSKISESSLEQCNKPVNVSPKGSRSATDLKAAHSVEGEKDSSAPDKGPADDSDKLVSETSTRHSSSDPLHSEAARSCESESSFEEVTMPSIEEDQVVKKKSGFEKTKQKFQKGLRKLSISDGLFPGSGGSRRLSLPASVSLPDFKHKKSDAASHANGKKSKSKEEKRRESCTNAADAKSELFTPLDKLIPRPATSFNDNPLYLCLRMGKPKEMSAHAHGSPVMYVGCKVKEEYWFSIPRNRVDNLYWFFLRWAPEKYGDIDDVDLEELGFYPVSEEEEISEPPPHRHSQRRGTWAFPWRRRKSEEAIEKVSHEDDPRSLSWEFLQHEELEESSSIPESTLPELLQPSDILKEEHIQKLSERLPARAVGYAWTLIYSTSVHGFNLKTLYREMAQYDTPVLLVVASTTRAVFGAMLSCPLRVSDHFYGTGESFLFTFQPEFKCYHWSGENGYFIKGNTGSFAVGASDGQFGLWLDDDLFHGCTKPCKTFGNEALCQEEDFVVRTLEAWGFV